MSSQMAEAILSALISPNESDRNLEAANVVDGLFAIARSIASLAKAIDSCDSSLSMVSASLDRLGTNNAATPMGALEVVAVELRDGLRSIASAVESLDWTDR